MSNCKTENQVGRPCNAEQFFALPVGPAIGIEVHELTDRDRERGIIRVRGETIVISGDVRRLNIPVMPETVVVNYSAEEPLLWRDVNGDYWTLGRYRDGRWFRKRS